MSDHNQNREHTILVIGERSGFVDQLAQSLEDEGFRFCSPRTDDALLDEIRRLGPDCVVLSERLTTRQALNLSSKIRTAFDGTNLPYVPLLYLHGGSALFLGHTHRLQLELTIILPVHRHTSWLQNTWALRCVHQSGGGSSHVRTM